MSYGFIYCLTNIHMPGICKIGYTERSPSLRCNELSSSTAVPALFDLRLYVEVEGVRKLEREIHAAFDEVRVSENREFFRCKPVEAYEWLRRNADIWTEYLDGATIWDLREVEQAQKAARKALAIVPQEGQASCS